MIDKILKAINAFSYEMLEDDKISIRLKYLLELKRHIEKLENEKLKLEKDLKYYKGEANKLKGKLLEIQNTKDFDMYM